MEKLVSQVVRCKISKLLPLKICKKYLNNIDRCV